VAFAWDDQIGHITVSWVPAQGPESTLASCSSILPGEDQKIDRRDIQSYSSTRPCVGHLCRRA